MNRKHIILLAAVVYISTGLFAATSFSGYAGGKLNYAANPEEEEFNPDLRLQALALLLLQEPFHHSEEYSREVFLQ